MILGVLLTVVVAFYPDPLLLAVTLLAVIGGLLAVGLGCQGDLAWVASAKQNVHATRAHTADFLRIMPTLISVSLAFNTTMNCMNFWYQEQACQMNLVVVGTIQVNGSFFNVADCIAIVVMTPLAVHHINPALDRSFGGFARHGKLLVGCILAGTSVLWAAALEVVRKASPLLPEVSHCAPAGVQMSDCPAWWMVGPYAMMGLAEVYVNPSLYFLAYSQTPPRLRSTAQAICLLMTAVSSALFTILTSILGSSDNLNDAHLEYGYVASVVLALPFLGWYLAVQASFVEKTFEQPSASLVPDDADSFAPAAVREVAYMRTGFFKDFASPRSPAGSPGCSLPSSPRLSPADGHDFADGPVSFVIEGA